MLDEGALKKDPAEAKAPAADTVDSDAEAHTTSPDRLPNPQDALAANAAAVDTGADDAVSPTQPPLALGLHERRQGCER